MTDFYGPLSSISFTILGLWFVVAQTRYEEWMASPEHRRRASAVSLIFALPGLVSLLSLAAPGSEVLWRASFAVAGTAGATGLALMNRRSSVPQSGAVVRLLHWASVAVYGLIAAVAAAPGLVDGLGIDTMPLRVEAVLLSVLLSIGVGLAWLLMFEAGDRARPEAEGGSGTRG